MGPRGRRLAAVLAIALPILAAAAVPAAAQPDSAVDQYREHIPEGTGDRPTRDVDEGDPGAVPPGAEARLEELGAAGEEAADLARRTAPPGGGDVRGSGGGGGDASRGAADASPSPAPAVAGQLGGGGEGGMGALLPVVLVAGLIAALAFVVLARRAARSDGPGES